MEVKTPQGNKDVQITDVNAENYIVPKGEEHLFHAIIEVKKFDANTGKRQSVPRVQKFGKKSFESGKVRENLVRQGYDIIILHDPNEWLKTHQLQLAEKQKQDQEQALENKRQKEELAAQQSEEAQQKKIDDAVAKALAAQNAANQQAIDKAVKAALAAQKPAKVEEPKSETKTKEKTVDEKISDAAKGGNAGGTSTK